MSPSELERVQGWFQDAVVRPSLPARARNAAAARADERLAAEHVRPSASLAPIERVAIYADAHFARLLGVLHEDFAALRALAGEALFERIARGYLADHPPHSFTLSELARALPEWIAAKASLPRRTLLADVARLERAMTVVFDAPRESVLSPVDLAALPPETWVDPKPRLIGALDLLAFGHRANAIVRATRHGESLPDLGRARTYTLVWRKDYVVWRQDLEPAACAVLSELRAGKSLAIAVSAAERAPDARNLEARVASWFSSWAQDGLFAEIRA